MNEMARKFRDAAESMQKTLDELNTPLFQGMPSTMQRTMINAGRRKRARRGEYVQTLLFALAAAYEDGTISKSLMLIRNKADVEFLYIRRRLLPKPLLEVYVLRLFLKLIPFVGNSEQDFLLFQDLLAVRRTLTEDEVKQIRLFLKKFSLVKITRENLHELGVRTYWNLKWRTESLRELTHFETMQYFGITTLEQYYTLQRELFALIVFDEPQRKKKKAITGLERGLVGLQIEGYFPTPPKVAEYMAHIAELRPWMRVLEPSAGKGNIADVIRKVQPNALLIVGEIVPKLRGVLQEKG